MIVTTTNYQNALAAFENGFLIFRMEIEGYSRTFTNFYDGITDDWIEDIGDLSISINDLQGGGSLSSFAITVSDIGGQITADFPSFVFEGAKVVVKQGFVGLSTADYAPLFVGYIDSVDSANGNGSYVFDLVDVSAKLSQMVYLTGDNGGQTSSENLKTLNAHPIDLMVDILLNQVKLDASLVDTTKLYAYRDGPFAGNQFLFHLQQPVAAQDFISKQLLMPLGGYLWVNSAGQVTANFFYPLAGPVAVGTFGPDTWDVNPEAQQTDMVNTVVMSFDKDDASSSASGNYLSVATQEYGLSVAKYGQYGEQSINADGMRSAFQGFFLAALTSRLIFMRYGLKNLMFDQGAAKAIWKTILFESGDIVSVTHPQIPDRQAGVIGITNKLFEILDKQISFKEGTIQYKMLDATYLTKFGFYKIAPSGEPAYTSATTGDKAKYMFLCGDNGEYSNTDTGHTLG